MPLTAGESQLLQFLGIAYLRYVAEVSIYCFSYGVFMLLFWKSVITFVRRGFSSRAIRFMFYATIINFILFSMSVGCQISGFVIFIRKALVETVDIPLVQRPPIANDALHDINIIDFWAGDLTTLISDLIVIWRAWVLFYDQKWLLIVPCILWLGAFGTQLTYLILLLTPAGFQSFATGGSKDMIIRAGIALSIATNAVTTAMIAYKLWTHRTIIVKNLGLSGRLSPAQKILVFLVESGVIYCAFQATYLGVTLRSDANQFAVYAFADIYFSLAAMYPTIVITLVESQRSIPDVCGLTTPSSTKVAVHTPPSGETRTATFGHLSFAAAAGQQSTVESQSESYFQASRGPGGQIGQNASNEKVVDIMGKENPNRLV